MSSFAQDFLKELESLHTAIERTVEGLPQEALDWSPGPDINSIAVLIVHTCGAERYLIGDFFAREPSNRDRDAEFETSDLDAAALKERVQAATAYARRILSQVTVAELESPRVSPRDGSERSVTWVLSHVLTHTAQHLGHLELTRHWWEQREQK